ncbi:MAG: hypothetical protein K2X93_13925 [Candidatus Obscuribacterales bacterium]|nr:hypothetical protein [Candidatus Obscuribacterales bacterium]
MIVQVEFTGFSKALDHLKDQQQLVSTKPSSLLIQDRKPVKVTVDRWQKAEPSSRHRRQNLLVG